MHIVEPTFVVDSDKVYERRINLRLIAAILSLLIIMNLFLSCAEKKTSLRFPIQYNNGYLPVITAIVSTGSELLLGFDTGADGLYLYSSGVNKLFPSTTVANLGAIIVKENYEKETGKNPDLISLSDFHEQYLSYFAENDISITIDEIYLKNRLFENTTFTYNPNRDSNSPNSPGIDGLVGLEFFKSCKNLVMDYRKNIIEVDGERIEEKGIPMVKHDVITNLYEIDFYINDKPCKGFIDTGLSTMIIGNDYGKAVLNWKNEEIVDFINNGEAIREESADICLSTITIGRCTYKNIIAHYGTDKNINTSPRALRMFTLYNFIGYPLFKGRRIQMDFEQGEFLID